MYTFSNTQINEVTRFLANTARYSPPMFFTMESTKYKTGSFSVDGAWSKNTSLEHRIFTVYNIDIVSKWFKKKSLDQL